MIVTEEEAKTKWCPEVRTGLTAGMAVNHHVGSAHDAPHAGDVHNETRCIGSGCMMWRWNNDPAALHRFNVMGYCGKGGKP